MTVEHYLGAYLIRHRGGSELVQTDWDYPATAERLGWNLRRVQPGQDGARYLQRAPNRGHGCDHVCTDGTIECDECGVTATEFIRGAAEFLDGLC